MNQSETNNESSLFNRRDMLRRCGVGMGMLGLGGLLAEHGLLADDQLSLNPLAPKSPHFAPKAKRVIHLFLNGGLSHMDTFDHKPALQKYHGKTIPGILDKRADRTGKALGSPFKFKQYGSNGLAVSELFPKTGEMIDQLCVVNSAHTDAIEHGEARLLMHCGTTTQLTPSVGSWLTYGLGTENQNLPGYLVLCPGDGEQPETGSEGWRSAFLPPIYQGTYIDTFHTDKVERLVSDIHNRYVGSRQQRRQIDLLHELNRRHLSERGGSDSLEARIQSYEMAYRMQSAAMEAFDLSQEPAYIHDMYGRTKTQQQMLLARRLAERGVRFIQAWTYPNQPFDSHTNLVPSLTSLCHQVDQGFSALVKDLDQRGLLDETLVIMCGEFGRMPTAEITENGKISEGRNHNKHAFNVMMAGGGIKPGIVYGATDDFGHKAVENRVHIHDLHATILHLMGFDHTKLTYRHAGRDFRLTDLAGNVIQDLIA